MTLDIDEGRFQTDARYRAWAIARRGAMKTRRGPTPEPAPTRRYRQTPRPRRTNIEILLASFKRHDVPAAPTTGFARGALIALRTMVILRDPPSAVADKIDDLLFKLRDRK